MSRKKNWQRLDHNPRGSPGGPTRGPGRLKPHSESESRQYNAQNHQSTKSERRKKTRGKRVKANALPLLKTLFWWLSALVGFAQSPPEIKFTQAQEFWIDNDLGKKIRNWDIQNKLFVSCLKKQILYHLKKKHSQKVFGPRPGWDQTCITSRRKNNPHRLLMFNQWHFSPHWK